jgi:hypothetical protein
VTARTLLRKWDTLDKAVEMIDYTPCGEKVRQSIKNLVPHIPIYRQLVTLRKDVPIVKPIVGNDLEEFENLSENEGLAWYKDKHLVLFERNMSMD